MDDLKSELSPSEEKLEPQDENQEEVSISNGLNTEEWNGIDIMESACMNCGETGKTVFMLHKIPYFRELIISSFKCEECGDQNNSVTFGGEIQLQGCVYTLIVQDPLDLDRQLIKSDSASLRIPELDFEIPPLTQKGEISTLEGFLRTAAKNLGENQDQRMEMAPEVGLRVAEIIRSLLQMSSGNSFVQSYRAPLMDSNIKFQTYSRTPSQDASLGIQTHKAEGAYRPHTDSNFTSLLDGFGGTSFARSLTAPPTGGQGGEESLDTHQAIIEDEGKVQLGRNEVMRIPSPCPHCGADGENLTAITDIPHFKEIILMAFTCEICGFRNSEVKGGGAVPTYGNQVTLRILSEDDLKRDVLKSDSASLAIPDLELEIGNGTLGGLFTTVEGLLKKMRTSLLDSNPFAVGDSNRLHHSEQTDIETRKVRFGDFMSNLERACNGQILPLTLVLRDPLGNSFISSRIGADIPPDQDEQLEIQDFERTYEENDEFGLNDINTAEFETIDPQNEGKAGDEGIRLPDRLTHVTVKGPDHPTFFAKGTHDQDDTPNTGVRKALHTVSGSGSGGSSISPSNPHLVPLASSAVTTVPLESTLLPALIPPPPTTPLITTEGETGKETVIEEGDRRMAETEGYYSAPEGWSFHKLG